MTFKSDDCYVAFIDILGFKNLIKGMPIDDIVSMFHKIDYSNKHTGIYYYIDKELQAVIPRNEIHYKIMSDSVVIYINANVEGALHGLIMYCSSFQSNLLICSSKPILCRGGIARGELYVDGEIIAGSGLVSAYELESKTAIFPRVVIPMNLVDECDLDKYGHSVFENVEKEDGFYVTKYVNRIILSNKGDEQLFERLNKYIYDNLASCRDTRIRDKFLYFEKQCIKWVEIKRKTLT